MSKPKALLTAEQQVTKYAQELAAAKAAVEQKKAAEAPARRRLEALLRRYRRPIVLNTSAGYRLVAGIAALGTGWGTAPKTAKAAAELFLTGERTIDSGAGGSWKVKGAVQRIRVPDAAHERAVRAAEKRRDRAVLALSRADTLLRDALREAFETGGKLQPEDIASVLGQKLVLRDAVTNAAPGPMDGYRVEQAERSLGIAQQHLAFVKSGQRDQPCPCPWCRQRRDQERWAAERAAAEKRREAEAKAEAKRIAALPRAEFTCPYCEERSVSPVFPNTGGDGEFVECQVCERGIVTAAIKTKRVSKRTPVGPISLPDDEDADDVREVA